MIEIFLKTFIFYFIVIDPIGSTPIFLVVTEHLEYKRKNKNSSSWNFYSNTYFVIFWIIR